MALLLVMVVLLVCQAGGQRNPASESELFRSIVIDTRIAESLASFKSKKEQFKECIVSSILAAVKSKSLHEVEQSRLNVHRVFAMQLAKKYIGVHTTLRVLKKDAEELKDLANKPSFHYSAIQCLEGSTMMTSIDFTKASVVDDDEAEEETMRIRKPSEVTRILFAIATACGIMGTLVFVYEHLLGNKSFVYQRVAQDKRAASAADNVADVSFREMYEAPTHTRQKGEPSPQFAV